MNNENLNGSVEHARAQFKRDVRMANECAEEVHFRTGQFLRTYNDPAASASDLVERARITRDVVDGFLQFLTILISEGENNKPHE